MAQRGYLLDHEKFCCSICLDVLQDPVTTPCGHSYCMNCIKTHWDEEEEKKIHSCPQCRQTFTPRPVLGKNTMLAVLVEELKKTGLQAAPADHCYAGPEDVACDVCTGRKLKALKSCLLCLVSYCEKHLQPHFESPAFEKHKLVEPLKKLQENICSRHDEVMKMFCRTDQQSICYLCSVDEHKGHDTVSAAAERTERQRQLEVSRQNIQQRIQDREKDVKVLQQKVEAINRSADEAVEDSEKIFTELIRLMEKRRSDVKQQVRSQQETEVSRVKELQEKLEQAAPADHCYAGPEDVACDVCTGRKLKALKSCLLCLVSYCEKHLQPHFESPAFEKHKLVEPLKKLQENICSRHDEVMKMFCRTDQQSICYLCSVDEHKGHDTVSAAAERTERQRQLEVSRQNIQQRIQDREKDVKVLQQKVEAINRSADEAVEDSEKIFTELIRLMEKRRSDVKQQVRSQQETEVSRVKELQEKLEQEITELKRKDAELKQLSHTEDHNRFLHNYPSVSALSESTDSSSINIRPLRYFEDVTAAVSEVRDKLQDALSEKWTDISLTGRKVDVLLPQQLRTREEFLQYACQITLDINTAHPWMMLSKGNRKVTHMRNDYFSHYDSSTKFIHNAQVLSRESLTGCCYWEVEWDALVTIAVAYKDISRSGSYKECAFGHNAKSWALYCLAKYEFRHNDINTPISGKRSHKVGVFLDHKAGTLSFYNVDETMTLLHRIQTTFTQPLYAGLGLHFSGGDNAELCELK
ncbi:tripartite motif-containing protein 16-like [Micropterus dolomieu]|uniref:tripartite motif-containing protein 16-like n=1 Tax=Micropterus dolomieu TaxID=147949 RepID=UPI001E8CF8D3|nr:tripartite motif-containing protein 16-like [Micropterus dolomieu]